MSSSTRRKRVTVVASAEGVKKAESALIRLGFESKSNFAKSQLLARNAVTKFFNRNPLQLDTFKRICDGLELKWGEILEQSSAVGGAERGRVEQSGTFEGRGSTAAQREGTMHAPTIKVTAVNQRNEVEAVIKLQGDITSIDARFKSTLEVLLKIHAGCTIEVTGIQSGSIRITIKGDQQGIERLIEQFKAGELTSVDSFPIETIYLVSEERPEEHEESNSENKWSVIQEILRNPKKNRNLQAVDLSDADLRYANLRRADLSDADLSDADLVGANLIGAFLRDADLRDADLCRADLRRAFLRNTFLSGANLRRADLSNAFLLRADLSGADLSGADLSGADLSGADLSGADLSGTNVRNARFGEGLGLSNVERQSLAARGAIFDDAPGDRESTYSPSRR